jgi:hypothetical protein
LGAWLAVDQDESRAAIGLEPSGSIPTKGVELRFEAAQQV